MEQTNIQVIDKIVPDTSVIIEGLLSEKIKQNHIKSSEIIIHEAVIAELEHQANLGKAIGFLGLDEIKRIKRLSAEKGFELSFKGLRPKAAEIRHASLGEIDSLIRQLAYDEDATLITSDKVQSEVALAKGMKSVYYKRPEKGLRKLKLERFFDETTMSVHLRENVPPYAKKGMPGNWEFKELRKALLRQEEIQDMSREIIEDAKLRRDGFIEIERAGSTIVQLGLFRIVITRPPFSDGWEITAVRPVKKLNLSDYNLSDKLMKRVAEQAEGVLVAGAPGMGKCVTGEEIVYTTNLMPLKAEDFFESSESTIYSIDKNGKFTEDKVLSKHKRKESIIHEIKTRTNRCIRVTPEHPLLVFEEDNIKWKEANKLKKGDRIAVLKNIRNKEDDTLHVLEYYKPDNTLCLVDIDKIVPIYFKYFGTKRKILELMCFKEGITTKEACAYCNKGLSTIQSEIKKLKEDSIIYSSNNRYFLNKKDFNLKDFGYLLLSDVLELNISKENIKKIGAFNYYKRRNMIEFPKKISPELCRFLGYIYSEGGGDKICFTNTNERLVNDFKKCAKEVFGINGWKKHKITYYIDWNASLMPMLRNWGYPLKTKRKSRAMKLPLFLTRCSLDNLRNFLQAYFDGDGGANKRSNTIEYYTSSENSATQLSLLLMRLGIFSSLSKKFQKGANRYTVRIFDLESIKKFSELVCAKDSNKYKDVLFCINKKYSQTLTYNLKPLLDNIYEQTKFKLKDSVSIEHGKHSLDRLYKIYYDFSSVNENNLLLLNAYINRINHMNVEFEQNKQKLKWKLLRENKMDHTCIRHWSRGRKIRISTLNKVMKVIGCGLAVSPKAIANSIINCIKYQSSSISEIARGCSVNNATLQLRILQGWNTNIDELERIYDILYNNFLERKKEMECIIKTLEIMFKSDIVFDTVVENNKIIDEFDVYDFETTNHNFVCGKLPFVVHNSTFAQALSEYYSSKDKIVKTVEAPRDLILPERITQYAISYGDAQEIHDILLLSRPDYTIFDEMRNTDDFKLFADLRLAGVGMVGVVHATSPVDAIQRFIGRVEMGVIPQVIDTVIFIKNGFINKVLSLKMTVKVPSGMTEADLARPVVVVNDFETDKLQYEIYSYGEQTVVIPVQDSREKKKGAHKLAETTILAELQKYSRDAEVEVLSDNKCIVYVPENEIARIIGKEGSTINRIEEKLGIGIDVKSLNEKYDVRGAAKEQKDVPFNINYKKNNLLLELGMDMQNRDVDIYAGEEFVLSAKAGKTGIIKIKRNNNIGRRLMEAMSRKEKLRLVV